MASFIIAAYLAVGLFVAKLAEVRFLCAIDNGDQDAQKLGDECKRLGQRKFWLFFYLHYSFLYGFFLLRALILKVWGTSGKNKQ